MTAVDFDTQISKYLDHIRADYVSWGKTDESDPIKVKIRNDMIAEFNNTLSVDRGSKYLKIVSRGAVHSFIVIKPDAKFKFGDILKAASWAAPAKNFSRGNLLNGDFSRVTWTGVV